MNLLALIVLPAIAAVAAYAASRALTGTHALLEAVLVAGAFGAVYLAVAAGLKLEQALAIARRLLRR